MNDADDDVKSEVDDGDGRSATVVQRTKCEPQRKDVKEQMAAAEKNTLRLLGEPIVSHGSYTFYGALAYRKRNANERKRRRFKKRDAPRMAASDENSITASKSGDDSSSSLCCCGDHDLCPCDGPPSSNTWSCSEWSAIHMNHFYAVRPWYSKRNSSISSDRGKKPRRSPKSSSSAKDSSERQHHYQQSVCIGELELLWRDDSVQSVAEQLEKRGNKAAAVPSSNDGETDVTAAAGNNNNGSAAASSEDEETSSALPRRRRLPRRTRQPSAKKLEATESYLAAAAVTASDNQAQSSPAYRQISSDPSSLVCLPSPSGGQYVHGNVLCSVRLYVMPDQTAAGRLSGVHGEDEVLEINTWTNGNGMGGVSADGGWSSCNSFVNGGLGSVYNGGGGIDDFGYGSGGHVSGNPAPTGCSGLVLRAEDFIEWVRGGLMNDDDTESDDSSDSASECDGEDVERDCIEKQIKKESELGPQPESKLESTVDVVKKEETEAVDLCKVKKEQQNWATTAISLDNVKKEEQDMKVGEGDSKVTQQSNRDVKEENLVVQYKSDSVDNSVDDYYSKSVDVAVEAEQVPLAAAKIYERHGLCGKALVNGSNGTKNDCRPTKTSTDKGNISLFLKFFHFFYIFFFLYFYL